MRTLTLVVTIFCTILAAAPRAQAQAVHAVAPSLLDAAIQQHVTSTAEERAAVSECSTTRR
jgi:hypothetical protein